MRDPITGGSGYIGTRLVDRLSRREDTESIVIGDVAAPRNFVPKTEFQKIDVRDRQAVLTVVEAAAGLLVHLAFILNPTHDEGFMYDVDVNGTQNVLEAAAAAGVGQVLVTTSAVAYGAFPDNPVPLTEDHPVRGVRASPTRATRPSPTGSASCGRASIPTACSRSCGPASSSARTWTTTWCGFWTKTPFTADVGTLDQQIQFVHEDDVVEAGPGCSSAATGAPTTSPATG